MKHIFLFIGLIGLLACGASKKSPDTAHNSQNSLSWAGRYDGTLNCADCDGILINLILEDDNTFRLSARFTGKSDKNFHTKGALTWSKNGDMITLSEGHEGVPMQFKVGENTLIPLNEKGKLIKDEKGTLQKNDLPITDKEWYLFELNGKNIKFGRDDKKPFLILSIEGIVSGNGGCNTYSGSYSTSNPNGIQFGVIAATKMACPSSTQLESSFFEVLNSCDNFTLNGDTLSLNKAKMAPLARFILKH